jgi:hypothetical protein
VKIPAQAYAQVSPNELEPGRLFLFRSHWALRVSDGAEFQGILMLDGERAGAVFQLAAGIAQCMAVVAPFNWFAMVADDAKPTVEDDPEGALMLTANGPVIVGLDARNEWDPTYIAFASDGQQIEAQDVHRSLRFEQWSVELCHPDRPFKSLGTLVELDRRKQP